MLNLKALSFDDVSISSYEKFSLNKIVYEIQNNTIWFYTNDFKVPFSIFVKSKVSTSMCLIVVACGLSRLGGYF